MEIKTHHSSIRRQRSTSNESFKSALGGHERVDIDVTHTVYKEDAADDKESALTPRNGHEDSPSRDCIHRASSTTRKDLKKWTESQQSPLHSPRSAQSRASSTSARSMQHATSTDSDEPANDERTILISRLSRTVTATHILEAASCFGKVVSVKRIFLDAEEPGSVNKNSFSVLYTSADAAQTACRHLDRGQMDGRVMSVELRTAAKARAKTKTAPPSSPRPAPTVKNYADSRRRSPSNRSWTSLSPPRRRLRADSRSPHRVEHGRHTRSLSRSPLRRRGRAKTARARGSLSRSPPPHLEEERKPIFSGDVATVSHRSSSRSRHPQRRKSPGVSQRSGFRASSSPGARSSVSRRSSSSWSSRSLSPPSRRKGPQRVSTSVSRP